MVQSEEEEEATGNKADIGGSGSVGSSVRWAHPAIRTTKAQSEMASMPSPRVRTAPRLINGNKENGCEECYGSDGRGVSVDSPRIRRVEVDKSDKASSALERLESRLALRVTPASGKQVRSHSQTPRGEGTEKVCTEKGLEKVCTEAETLSSGTSVVTTAVSRIAKQPASRIAKPPERVLPSSGSKEKESASKDKTDTCKGRFSVGGWR